MHFGKLKMFLGLNGLIAAGLLCYFSLWLAGTTVKGTIVSPFLANTMTVTYKAGGKTYTASFMRNETPYAARSVPVRYLNFRPSVACIPTFLGLWAEPLAWWGMFLFVSALLLLTNNTVFSKGTVFHLHRRFPWISMDEYFPDAGNPPAGQGPMAGFRRRPQKKLNDADRKTKPNHPV